MSIKRINLGEKCTIDIAEDQVHVYQFYNFIKQAGVFYKRAGEWIKGISEDPTSAPETTVNFIAYSGAVAEVSEGVEDLKKRLAGYLARDKTAAREKRGEYEAAAGVSKAKL